MISEHDILLLRFQAPMMSFGAPIVDNYGTIRQVPALSMITGLLGNALGYDHREHNLLQRLQERIRFAARIDRCGREIIDYQTVDLGQDFMEKTGWTNWGEPESRAGGSAASGTHIRYRHFLADGELIIALLLTPIDESPRLDDLQAALNEPARPLFLGRKSCLPATPILAKRTRHPSLLDALKEYPAGDGDDYLFAQWPVDEGENEKFRLVGITDERDWKNQLHCGKRFLRQGMIKVLKG